MDYLIDDSDNLAAFLETVHFWREKLEYSATPEALESVYQAIPTPIRGSNALLSLRLLLLSLMEAKGAPYEVELEALVEATRKMLGDDHELSRLSSKDDSLWRLYIDSPRLRYMRLEMRHQDYLYLASVLYRISILDKAEIFYRKVFAFIDQTLSENELEALSAGCLIAQCLLGRIICGRIGIWPSSELLYEKMFCLLGQTLIVDYPHVQSVLQNAINHPYFDDKHRDALPVLQSLHLREVDVFGRDQKPQNLRHFVFDSPPFKNATRTKKFWQQVLEDNADAITLSLQNLWKAQTPVLFFGNASDRELLVYFKHLQKLWDAFFGPDDEKSIDANGVVSAIEEKLNGKPLTAEPTCDPF